jgi:hypothetical protein
MNLKWVFFDLGWALVDEAEAHRSRLAETSTILAGFGKQYSVDQLFSLTEQAASNFAVWQQFAFFRVSRDYKHLVDPMKSLA